MSNAWARLLCLMIFLHGPVVLAQPTGNAPASRSGDPVYDDLIAQGIAEFNLGHWGEAKAFFLRAHARRPNARTLRSLGLTSYEQRLYVDAIGYMRQALVSQDQPLTPDLRSQLQQRLTEARSFVTHVRLELDPWSITVRVDGEQPVLDEDGSIMLDPGQHDFTAEAPDYESQVRTITAHGAERMELAFSLAAIDRSLPEPTAPSEMSAPTEPAAAVPAEPARAPEAPSLGTPQWVGIGFGIAGVVAAGVAGGFSLAAAHENNVSKRTCTDASCEAPGREARKSALAHADVATASIIAAGAFVAVGAICFFALPVEPERPATTALRMAPALSHQTAGLILSGEF